MLFRSPPAKSSTTPNAQWSPSTTTTPSSSSKKSSSSSSNPHPYVAAEVDAQSFGCVGEAEATYGWGLLLLLLLFLLLLLGVVVVEGDHCALDGVSQRRHFDFLHITIRGA